MNNEDYLSRYLDDVELKETIETKIRPKPSWVDPSNHSEKAHDAIENLKVKKLAFIKKHGKKSDYKTKGSYMIGKAEVARLVGPNVKPQPLFHSKSTPYCKHLLEMFNKANEDLELQKEKRLSKKGRGLIHKTKEELVEELRAEKESKTEELTSLVDDVYQRTLDNLSLDVKRKLGLL